MSRSSIGTLWSSLTVPQLIGLVQYFKSQSTLPVTYNFAGETFLLAPASGTRISPASCKSWIT